jgi:hypothetical protein
MNINILKLFRISVVIAIINIAVIPACYFLFPESRDFLVAEDRLAEDLQALFYFLCFFPGILFILRIKEKKFRRIYIALPFIGLLFFLEEISYGARIFKFHTALIYNEYFDALHDLVPIAYNYLELNVGYLLKVLPVAFCIITVILVFKYRRLFTDIPALLNKYPPIGFFLIAAGFIFPAQVFDLNLVKPDFSKLIEELFELNGSLFLLSATLSTGHVFRKNTEMKQPFNENMKRMLSHIFIIFSVLVIFGLGSYSVLYLKTAGLEKESNAYIEKIFPLVFNSWDPDSFMDELMPELHRSDAQNQKIRTSFDLKLKQFGRLKNYKLSGSEPVEMYKNLEYFRHGKDIFVFTNYVDADFEKTTAKLRIVTIKKEGKWIILGLKIDSVR